MGKPDGVHVIYGESTLQYISDHTEDYEHGNSGEFAAALEEAVDFEDDDEAGDPLADDARMLVKADRSFIMICRANLNRFALTGGLPDQGKRAPAQGRTQQRLPPPSCHDCLPTPLTEQLKFMLWSGAEWKNLDSLPDDQPITDGDVVRILRSDESLDSGNSVAERVSGGRVKLEWSLCNAVGAGGDATNMPQTDGPRGRGAATSTSVVGDNGSVFLVKQQENSLCVFELTGAAAPGGTLEWKLMPASGQVPTMDTHFADPSVVFYSGSLYVFGEFTTGAWAVYIYSVRDGVWREVKADGPDGCTHRPRIGISVVAVGQFAVMAGGYMDEFGATCDCSAFDMHRHSWHSLPTLDFPAGERFVALDGDQLIVTMGDGGYSGWPKPYAEALNVSTLLEPNARTRGFRLPRGAAWAPMTTRSFSLGGPLMFGRRAARMLPGVYLLPGDIGPGSSVSHKGFNTWTSLTLPSYHEGRPVAGRSGSGAGDTAAIHQAVRAQLAKGTPAQVTCSIVTPFFRGDVPPPRIWGSLLEVTPGRLIYIGGRDAPFSNVWVLNVTEK